MSLIAIAVIILAYFLGSISSAVLISQIWRLPDPRKHGSCNPGATNIYRLGGAVPAILTLFCDVLKGTIPVWGAYFLGIQPVFLGLIAISACLGHIYPVFFGFKGGKAVATAFGALLPIGLDLGGLLIATWLVVLITTRYSSLAAIVTVSFAPIYTWFIKPLYTVPVIMLMALIIFRHRENIVRLLKGQEETIFEKGKKKKKKKEKIEDKTAESSSKGE